MAPFPSRPPRRPLGKAMPEGLNPAIAIKYAEVMVLTSTMVMAMAMVMVMAMAMVTVMVKCLSY